MRSPWTVKEQRVAPADLQGAGVTHDRWGDPAVLVELADGRRLGLPGVRPDEIDEVRAWWGARTN